jgi:hypothetical protein
MDDEFMHSVRRQPSAEFARRLRQRLERTESRAAVPKALARVAAYAAALVLAVGAFALPSVRAAAAAFLDLFRVVNFAPVAVQPERVNQLAHLDLDVPAMLGKRVEILKDSGPPQTVDTPEAASAATGRRVQLPAWRPVGMEISRIEVWGERAMRVTADTTMLRQVMEALAIDDLQVPEGLDGQTVTIRVPPAAHVEFAGQERGVAQRVALVQARHPEVSFPAGTDLTALAEIGLRVLGVAPAEAHRFAQDVDWRTTLIVPVPANVSLFRQVNVQGHAGLFIEQVGSAPRVAVSPGGPRGPQPRQSILMWSAGDSVFALVGNVGPSQLLEMAQTVQ